jgi:ATP-dependent DNA helicase RecG
VGAVAVGIPSARGSLSVARTLPQLAALDVSVLRGVGPARASALASMDIHTVLDVLLTYPRRYVDRTRQASIGDLVVGDEATVLATVRSCASRQTRGRRRMVTASVVDPSGSLVLTFFNQPWRERQLTPGTEVMLFGKVESFRGRPQMTNPVVDLVGDRTGRVVPVYPQSEKAGVASWEVARLVAETLRRSGEFADPVPSDILGRWGLVGRTAAFGGIHTPEAIDDVGPARTRLVFDELLRLQLRLVQRKRQLERDTPGIAHQADGSLVNGLLDTLPFPLTDAQERVVTEITDDLARPRPMHRLLQGDVGSGKTLVAVAAMLVAVEGGHQAAMMAPTEVLAEQHAAGIGELLSTVRVPAGAADGLFAGVEEGRALRVALLTSRTPAAQRRKVLAGLADGSVEVVIGTHALLTEGVEFADLGLVVIDEQHRFGVEQRAALRRRGSGGAAPDVLVMTATPIPRTAAMTVYGDLDVSVLDTKPPGRTPIVTRWVRTADEEDDLWAAVRAEVAAGRQAYVVCPLIDESDKLDAASATETFERLTAPDGPLTGLSVGLLHGRMPAAERDATMATFRSGGLDVLVATTVIEVGVDVPNATAMVILDAGRFGIAQLHQLRGRVGRGAAASQCWLVGDPDTPEGVARLEALVASEDGFALAEVDLDLRGEGTLMGDRQKGRNDLRLASLRRDREWVERARAVAVELVGDDPTLASQPLLSAELDTLLPEGEETDFLLKG